MVSEAARHLPPPPAQTTGETHNQWLAALLVSEGSGRPTEDVCTTAAISHQSSWKRRQRKRRRTGSSAASVEQSADARLATSHKSWNNIKKNISLPVFLASNSLMGIIRHRTGSRKNHSGFTSSRNKLTNYY